MDNSGVLTLICILLRTCLNLILGPMSPALNHLPLWFRGENLPSILIFDDAKDEMSSDLVRYSREGEQTL